MTLTCPRHPSLAVMLKGQAALLWGVLGEAHSLLAPSRDPTNLEAAAPTAFLRGAATEGARGRWSKLTKQLLQAAKERKARTFSEAMPSMVAAPGMGAFTFAEPAPKTARGDEGGGGAAKLSRRERAALQEAGATAAPGAPRAVVKVVDPKDKSAQQRQLDFSTAVPKFTNQGAVFEIGPATNGESTRYDAAAARKSWGEGKCLPFLFTTGMYKCANGCPTPGDPAHAADGEAHTLPANAKSRKEFNLKRTTAAGNSPGRGRGGGKGGGGGRGGRGGGRGGGAAERGGKAAAPAAEAPAASQ